MNNARETGLNLCITACGLPCPGKAKSCSGPWGWHPVPSIFLGPPQGPPNPPTLQRVLPLTPSFEYTLCPMWLTLERNRCLHHPFACCRSHLADEQTEAQREMGPCKQGNGREGTTVGFSSFHCWGWRRRKDLGRSAQAHPLSSL